MADESVFLKLFDTLKEAINEMNSTLKDLLSNQQTIGNYVESLPIKEFKDTLKEHNKESSDNIDECTEVVNTQSSDILKKLDKIYAIVFKTTVVVSVFITIVSCIFTYNKYLKSDSEHDQLEKTIITLQKTLKEEIEKSNKRNDEQIKLIDGLRKTIRELQNEN